MLKILPLKADLKHLIVNAIDVFDVCRINRNALTHFMVTPGVDGTYSFLRMKGPVLNPQDLPSSLTDIRRIAAEVEILSVYLWNLYEGLKTYDHEKPHPLPPLIAVPELLWKPPPGSGAKQPQKRKPSVPKLSVAQKRAKAKKDARLKVTKPT
ncbi:MAG: hypothetical protein NVSMB26_23140 [Beijerinckiaceae bacterium]